jgi:L-ascorbate metabolism protein UlaG (beta-lactamase superfamily)
MKKIQIPSPFPLFILFLLMMGSPTLVSAQGNVVDGLRFTYFGGAGWEISDDKVHILIDPYISRVKLGNSPSNSKQDDRKSFFGSDFFISDTTTIDKLIKKADYILVHHSHVDHLGDVPYIAKKTGAKVIGTETTANILRAYGIPDEQLFTVKGGEDYQFENFSVKVVPSIHSALNKKHYFDSRQHTDAKMLKAPLMIKDFIEGGSLMFLVRFDSHEVLTAGSMNFLERELKGLRPDIILPGVNLSRLEIYNYTKRLLSATGFPKIVIPTHWDNFRLPYGFSQEESVEKKLKPFIAEVKAASPESKVLVPVHLETFVIK